MEFIRSIWSGENKYIEYKERYTKGILKTISAFSNYHEGIIVIGVADNEQIVGVNDPVQTRLSIENTINDSVKPRPDFEIYEKTVGNATILALKIFKGQYTPYVVDGKAYRRADTSTVPVEKHEYDELVLYGRNLSFEELEYKGMALTFHKLGGLLSEKLGVHHVNEDVLRSLELINHEKWTNAAAFLADKNTFSDLGIDMIAYSDNDMTVLKDRINLRQSSVLEYFDAAIAFYKKHINQGDVIRGAYRKSFSEVPLEAYREVVANAIIHRDYGRGGNCRIEIFDDRIEVTSIGGLPIGISEEEFRNGTFSNVRNKVIANIFLRCGIIEKMGTGIRRMKIAYKDYPEKPLLKAFQNSVQIVLPRVNFDKVVKEDKGQMTNEEEKLYQFIKVERLAAREQVEEFLSVKKTKATTLLKGLSEKGAIVKMGVGKNTKYRVLNY